MALTVTTPPTAEPVSLPLAKLHLRVDHDDDDTLISVIIEAARGYCERWCRKTFPTTTLKLSLDQFPCGSRPIIVPNPPLVSVSSITYVDGSGATVTLGASSYTVDNQSQPGRLVPAYGLVWPQARGHANDVAVTFVAGSAAVPKTVVQAMLLLIGHWYEHRESVVTGSINSTLEMAVESLLWSERSQV